MQVQVYVSQHSNNYDLSTKQSIRSSINIQYYSSNSTTVYLLVKLKHLTPASITCWLTTLKGIVPCVQFNISVSSPLQATLKACTGPTPSPKNAFRKGMTSVKKEMLSS